MPSEDVTLNLKVEPDNCFRAMLIRAASRFTPKTIIDVGASNGSWSRMAREIWPEANLLLFEPNPVFKSALDEMEAAGAHVARALCCATDTGQTAVRMNFDKPYQGVYDLTDSAHAAGAPETVSVPVHSIDHEVQRRQLPGPYLIKLDTHGREHEILAGARQTLVAAVGLVIEVYTWSQGPNSMRAADLIPHIEREHGFLPADLCEPLRRPYDQRMVQFDLLLEPVAAQGMQTPNLW